MRTLADLTNPSEVRGALQIARQSFQSQKIGPALISFAQRILPNRYQFLYQLSAHRRDLLFAKLETGAFYSEFHMAAGERVVLRLSREISELHDALILIDEVDVGLHPFTQQHLMLELQRIALRNSLQIIVTTHSPVIIESVPPEGRIFLEREDDNVKERTPYRDVLQRALYGRPLDRLSILCEDSVAKYLILGVMDWLSPRLNLSSSDVDIGHDTGKDEFPHHVRLLARLQQMSDFLFVIDGDGRTMESKLMGIAKRAGQPIDLLFLPGDGAPEEWIWERLHQHSREYADRLHIDCAILERQLNLVGRSYESAVGKKSDVAKYRLGSLLEGLGHTVENVCRVVGYAEADSGFLVEFRERLHDAIIAWRGRQD
ncbi:MAG: AAA family ATPase [Candidatus Sumerlaeota bacterium]|nr:AAA family ATPase [Candidatus Sumerlaeota bacterium]